MVRKPFPPQSCPDLPIILYISNSGALVERMAACQPGECDTLMGRRGGFYLGWVESAVVPWLVLWASIPSLCTDTIQLCQPSCALACDDQPAPLRTRP